MSLEATTRLELASLTINALSFDGIRTKMVDKESQVATSSVPMYNTSLYW